MVLCNWLEINFCSCSTNTSLVQCFFSTQQHKNRCYLWDRNLLFYESYVYNFFETDIRYGTRFIFIYKNNWIFPNSLWYNQLRGQPVWQLVLHFLWYEVVELTAASLTEKERKERNRKKEKSILPLQIQYI